MTPTWTEPESNDAWDAYLDWPGALPPTEPISPLPRLQPMFLKLKGDLATARQQLQALISDADSGYYMETTEAARLAQHIASPQSATSRGYAAFRHTDKPLNDHDTLWEILDLGPAMLCAKAPALPMKTATAAPWQAGQPIVACIDDGIGYLNARFTRRTPCTGETETRLRAIWLQSDLLRSADPSAPLSCGQVLTAEDINALLQDGTDESTAYALQNAKMRGTVRHRMTELAATHGTAVLDIAGGADPVDTTDPARDWPLLAVQLPPAAVDDTTGTLFEAHVVSGLRWILQQAAAMSPTSPVIVNISMGMLAGPKNGSRFTEYQITQEAKQWEAETGQPVRIVWAFGNGRRTRQVARLTLEDDSPQHLIWRVQPDDLTPSYAELRSSGGPMAISLTPPGGDPLPPTVIAPGEARSLMHKGQPIARIYSLPERRLDDSTAQPACLMLALAPTGSTAPGAALAPSGAWTITLGGMAQTITAQIQRDQSLPGYPARGRQSYFDGPEAWAWDKAMQDNTGLAPASAITREGTHSALVTASARQVFTVGAGQLTQGGEKVRPTFYSGEGSPETVPGPTLTAIAEDGLFLKGVLAAGTTSSSVRALNGTSAAAARVSRALSLSAARLAPNATTPQLSDFDPELTPTVPVPARMQARLGQAVLEPLGETRERRAV